MLPQFKIEPARKRGYVKVTCPRATCRKTFWANRFDLMTSNEYTSRPCPFCFKAAKIK